MKRRKYVYAVLAKGVPSAEFSSKYEILPQILLFPLYF